MDDDSQMRQSGFLSSFSCDEEVMTRLLATDYLETLERRNDPNRRLGSIFCELLKSLLEKDYNLSLIQAVCLKVARSLARARLRLRLLLAAACCCLLLLAATAHALLNRHTRAVQIQRITIGTDYPVGTLV
jgi:hypothetical protein